MNDDAHTVAGQWLRQRLQIVLKVIHLIGIGYALSSLLFTLFVILDRSHVVAIEFIKTGYRVALWPLPLLLLIYLVLRRWRIVGLLLPGLIAFVVYYVPYYAPKASQPPPELPPITVLTFNILRDGDDLAQAVADSHADLVAIQELSVAAADNLSQALADVYPYHVLNPEEGLFNAFRGMGLFSRYPILDSDYWVYDDLLPYSHGHQRVVIDMDGTPVVVYNVHPWPPVEWQGGLRFSINITEAEAHRITVERLVARVFAEDDPVIMLGDFNMSDQFLEYELITSRLIDGFRAAGQGMGYTYPAGGLGPLPPLMRLDYVFHSPHFQSLSAQVLSAHSESDHLPVLVTLALRQPAP